MYINDVTPMHYCLFYVNMDIVTPHIYCAYVILSTCIAAPNNHIYTSSKSTPLLHISTMNFLTMTNITVGVFPTAPDNVKKCMKYGLEREFKMDCHNIPGMWPNGAGSLLFFLVIYVVSNLFLIKFPA